MFFPLSRSSGSDCDATDSCQSLDNPDFIAMIVLVSWFGLISLCSCYCCFWACRDSYRQRCQHNRAVGQLPEEVPVVERVVNIVSLPKPPIETVTFHEESVSDLPSNMV